MLFVNVDERGSFTKSFKLLLYEFAPPGSYKGWFKSLFLFSLVALMGFSEIVKYSFFYNVDT